MKHIHVKLFPRYIASPLYMGIALPTSWMMKAQKYYLNAYLTQIFRLITLRRTYWNCMPSVISTSPATRRQNRWIFSEKTGKSPWKNSLCMERNHYRRRHGHHGGRYFLGHSSGRCSFRPENAFRTPRPENHRPWQSRLLVEHRIKNETNDRQCFWIYFQFCFIRRNIALAGTRDGSPRHQKNNGRR